MAEFVPITDPEDPRLKDTPVNPPQDQVTQVDLNSYVANHSVPDANSLPELSPSKTTFYFPATPEETRRAGLSYRMEGGIHGGGQFSDIDLRNHTLEKYDAGDSKFVAIAMPGEPSGAFFQMKFPDGGIRTVRNIDTGGGLVTGQADIATSNPNLARGGGTGGGGILENTVGESMGSGKGIPVSEEEINAIVGKGKEEPKQRPTGRKGSTFIPTPIPEVTGTPRIYDPFQIPEESSGIGYAAIQPTPTPGLPGPSPAPMPTPDNFQPQVQEAISQSPLYAATGDIDLAAYVRANQSPTPTPTATPAVTSTPNVDLSAYVRANTLTSPRELPTPQGIDIRPSGVGEFIGGVGAGGMDILKSLIPNTRNIRGFATIAGAPVNPDQFIKQAAQTAVSDVQMIKEAKKAGLLSRPAGRAAVHIGSQLLGTVPALRTGAMIRAADEAATLDRPPIQNAVAGRTGSAAAIHEQVQQPTVTSEIANKFVPERQLAGELGDVTPYGPIIPSDVIAATTKLSPEEIAQHISDLIHNRGGSFLQQSAAVVVEESRLSQRSTELSKLARSQPTQANKLAAEQAFQDVTDFHNGPVVKMKAIWSAGGKVMQSSNPIDLAALNGQREAWLRDVGTAPPPEALPVLQKLADDMFKANKRMTDLQQMWRADANSLNPRVTPEMVREQILAKLKEMTPC